MTINLRVLKSEKKDKSPFNTFGNLSHNSFVANQHVKSLPMS